MDKNRENLLVLGHVWPQPNATAAGEHIMHLLECFSEMNYQIHFASAAAMPEGYTFSDTFNSSQYQININDDGFDDLLKEVSPDVVLFDRFMIEEQFSWRVKSVCPDAIRILDTEDLHFLRKEREQVYKGKPLNNELSDIAKRELASIYRCDLSLIISKFEFDLLVNEYHIPNEILCYFPLVSDGNKKEIKPFEERKHLFFVGNFLHEPNWQTVQYLKKEIWPILKQQLPNVELHIYGSYAQQKHLQLHNPKDRFLIKGYVDDIGKVFSNYRLLIAPIPFGAGQKGKLLKALDYQLPFVTSSIGAEAMFLEDSIPEVIHDKVEDFVAGVTDLYFDADKWGAMQQKLISIRDIYFNKTGYFKVLKNKIESLKEGIEGSRSKNIVGQLFWHHSMKSTEYMSRWIMEKNKRINF